MARHGPHHGAQKSMSTGRSLVTTPSNVALVTCTIELLVSFTVIDLFSSPRLRRDEPRSGFRTRAAAPGRYRTSSVVHKSTRPPLVPLTRAKTSATTNTYEATRSGMAVAQRQYRGQTTVTLTA